MKEQVSLLQDGLNHIFSVFLNHTQVSISTRKAVCVCIQYFV